MIEFFSGFITATLVALIAGNWIVKDATNKMLRSIETLDHADRQFGRATDLYDRIEKMEEKITATAHEKKADDA